jgi:predicted nucleic acid-binding protein
MRHPLRAYDAIQLASALGIYPSFEHAAFTSLTFLAADDRLLAIAQAEGLHTDNPNHYP